MIKGEYAKMEGEFHLKRRAWELKHKRLRKERAALNASMQIENERNETLIERIKRWFYRN